MSDDSKTTYKLTFTFTADEDTKEGPEGYDYLDAGEYYDAEDY